MRGNKNQWIYTGSKSVSVIPSNYKSEIQDYFQPIIEEFKIKCIRKNPNDEFNFLVDIYSKWNKNCFYVCEKYKSKRPNRVQDEFEVKLIRLKYLEQNSFELSYFRHTDQWFTIPPIGMTLKECKGMILSNPILQPTG
ncbi:MAG TPA: hypothetical protein PKW50_05090 [Syntrophomonas sp.]|nr:hypothetical protein [Syntrophomonas sp.]